jgi:16S rRNA (guanine527-N7)-methyltransferase
MIPALNRQLKNTAPASSQGFRVLDVGAGAGLPGVIIAICRSDISVTCVDAVAKKIGFIQQVAVALKLPNLRGLHARVETLSEEFDIVCSRAFANLLDFTTGSSAALAPGGAWLAMKGKEPTEEIAQLGANISVFHVEHLSVPGLDAQRCLVWMRRAGET